MTGPFLVKQLQPTVGYDVTVGADPVVERGARVVSVKAFETLEKARGWASLLVMRWEEAHDCVNGATLSAASAAEHLPAEGGKVELPDGLVEVRRVPVPRQALAPGLPGAESRIATAARYILDGKVNDDGWPGAPASLSAAEWVAATNAAMAERYGTEGR